MDRRRFLLTSLAGVLAAPLVAGAQQAKNVPRLGYLSSSSAEREKSLLAAFQQGLQELGYSAGKNIVIEQRIAEGRYERLPDLAAELVRLKVDVLVVADGPATHAANKATSTIPIVMTSTADPVGIGVAASLAHPGGNVTGLSDFHAGVVTKRLELLRDLVPSASRVAVLSNPSNPTNPLQLKLIQAVAPAIGVTLFSLDAKGPDDIDRAFTAIREERPGALLVIGDPMLAAHRRQIVELVAKSRSPGIYSSRPYPDAGGLISYGTDFNDLRRRAAIYVDKILKGAKPADLPIEQPTKFELVINLKTAKALGLTIPPSLLLRADQVIE